MIQLVTVPIANNKFTNVLLISNSSEIGGGNRSLLLLHHGLKNNGISAKVIVPTDGPMVVACNSESVPNAIQATDDISWRRPDKVWLSSRQWKRIIQQFSTNLVHANDLTTARSVAIGAWRAKVPVVCHVRFPAGPEFVNWVFKRYPKPAAFIFNSHALQDECGPDFERACPRSTQYVVHNAVDLQRFQPKMKQSESYRVGILANLIPIKGHKDFLQMAHIIRKQVCNVDFSIIGEDIHNTGYKAELQKLSSDLGLNDIVHFLGHRNDIPELLSEMDLLVCPSHVEPFGRCLIEAMACEKPVVASRVGGIPEVVDDGVTGVLVPAHSPQALADSVMNLYNDRKLADSMGKAGRRRVEKLFTPEAHTEAVLEVYETVLKSKTKQ